MKDDRSRELQGASCHSGIKKQSRTAQKFFCFFSVDFPIAEQHLEQQRVSQPRRKQADCRSSRSNERFCELFEAAQANGNEADLESDNVDCLKNSYNESCVESFEAAQLTNDGNELQSNNKCDDVS